MPSVVRSTFVLGALALAVTTGLTACGDKVNVTQPQADSSVSSVTVSPQGPVPMKIGDKVTFSASVVGGPQLTNHAVTWTSANSAIASVDQNGVVSALTGGTTSIIATSKANNTISGAAIVTVAASVNATVTIGQINQTVCTPTCTSVPATLTNVANQLDVTLNVDPGTQTISEVDLVMNCVNPPNSGADTVVARQTLGTSDKTPLSAEAAASPLTLSFPTNAFNATTGVVSFKNGQCSLKGKAITTAGTQTASSLTQLTLNNVNLIIPTMITVPGTGQVATATDANGLLWHAGAVSVTAVPVIYTPVTIASAAISITNAGNDQALGKNGVAVLGNTAIGTIGGLTPTAGVVTASFPLSTTATGGVGGAVVDTLGVTVTTVDNTGNPGPTLAASPATLFIRLDNRAPDITSTAPIFIAGTQNTANGWVGKAFLFSVGTTGQPLNIGSAATDNQVVITAISPTSPGGGGVDKVVTNTQFAPQGTAASSTAWATFTSVTSLAETPAATGPVAYDLRLQICDALGNCSTTPTLTTFGVDLTPPTEIKGSTPADKEIVGIGQVLSSTTLQVAGTDPQGANGVTGSGFGSNPVLVQETQLAPSGATGQTNLCVIGTAASPAGSGCKTPFAGNAFASPQTVALVTNVPGQYSLVFQVTDQAGNMSAPDSVRYYLDQAAPGMSGGISIPASITNGSTFTASGIDDMDFASVNAVLTYPGLPNPSVQISGTSSAAGVAFDNVLTRASTATVTLANFFRQLGTMDAAGAVAGETKPSSIGIRGVDAANNLSAPDVAAFPATNITTGVSLAGTTLGFTITSNAATLSNGTNNTGTPPRSATLTATVNALNANAGTPFAQVCFYISNPTGAQNGLADKVSQGAAGELFQLGCTATTTTILNGTQKQILSTMSFDPNALYGTAGNLTLWAIGVTAAGDASITAAPVVIGLAN